MSSFPFITVAYDLSRSFDFVDFIVIRSISRYFRCAPDIAPVLGVLNERRATETRKFRNSAEFGFNRELPFFQPVTLFRRTTFGPFIRHTKKYILL